MIRWSSDDCVYNSSIECNNRNGCLKCGWNPKVFEKRKRDNRKAIRDAAEIKYKNRWRYE